MEALPADVAELINRAADVVKVDRPLARAVAWVESRGQHFAEPGTDPARVLTSRAGALGVMQLMPATAEAMGANPMDLVSNVNAGVALLGRLVSRLGRQGGLAAYNWGVGRVNARPEPSSWPESVRAYVASVLTRAALEERAGLAHASRSDDLPEHGARAWNAARDDHAHNGIDFPAPEGSPVYAAASGVVEHAVSAWQPGFSGYGRALVVASEDGTRQLYGHMSSLAVGDGETVEAGSYVGEVGTTRFTREDHEARFPPGQAHVHFEVSPRPYPQENTLPRLDPVAWLRSGRVHPLTGARLGAPSPTADAPTPEAPTPGPFVAEGEPSQPSPLELGSRPYRSWSLAKLANVLANELQAEQLIIAGLVRELQARGGGEREL